MNAYLHDSLTYTSMGLPIGVFLGYCVAQIENLLHRHRRHR